jgi:hypothetical protein
MTITYTKAQTEAKVLNALGELEKLEENLNQSKSMSMDKYIYNKDFVNYTGKTGGDYYTDVVAAVLLDNIDRFKKTIQPITRGESYKVNHPALPTFCNVFLQEHQEEWIAKSLLGKDLGKPGKVWDYQTPLKDKQDDKAGKIDLFSYNEADKFAYILELKKLSSVETLLRCVLEAYTYWAVVDRGKLLGDFGLPATTPDTTLRKAVLVYAYGQAYQDFHRAGSPALKLMRELKVDFFVLGESATEYAIP